MPRRTQNAHEFIRGTVAEQRAFFVPNAEKKDDRLSIAPPSPFSPVCSAMGENFIVSALR